MLCDFMLEKSKEYLLKNISLDADTLEFLTHSKNYLSTNFIVKLLSLISIPIYTRLLLPESYGLISIFTSVVTILIILLTISVKGGIFRYFFENKKDFPDFLGTNLIFLALFSSFISVLVWLFGETISGFFKLPQDLLLIAVIVSIGMTFFGIYGILLQAKKESKEYSKITIIQAVLQMVLSIIWVYLLISDKHMGVIYATLLVWLAFFAYSLFKLSKQSKFVLKKSYLWYSMVFGLPLLPHAFGGYILTYFDRVIIGQLTNMAEVGLYSFAYNVGLIMTIIIASISSAWSPMFFEQMNKKNYAKIEDITKKYAKIVFIIALILVLFSREIITVLADIKYHAALEIIPIIILSYVFAFLYGIYLMYSEYRKKTWLISIATIIAAMVNIWLNYLLIPIYGYKIAAYTTFISYVLLFLLHYLTVKVILKENAIRLKVFIPGLVALFILSMLFLTVEKIADNFIILLLVKFLILAIMALVLFKKLREKFFNQISLMRKRLN
mgnify:CR=1 FL=1